MNPGLFDTLVLVWIGLALAVVPRLLRQAAPYGRHTTGHDGPTVDNRLGWMIMELISPLAFGYFFLNGGQSKTAVTWIFFSLWVFHYGNRSLIFPLRLQTKGKRMPLQIMLSAVVFNAVNGFLNGYYLGHLGPVYTWSWVSDVRFTTGLLLFAFGLALNWHADQKLLSLRRCGKATYSVPKGRAFRWVSCPNYLGELIEWGGFALMTWSLPAFSFFVWTAANLVPRALTHHAWYRQNFDDYPKSRKAIIPFIL